MIEVKKIPKSKLFGIDKTHHRAKLGPLEATGDTVTDAREALLERAHAVLSGNYEPMVIQRDGIVGLVYRTPMAGWCAAITAKDALVEVDRGGSKERSVRCVRRRLARELQDRAIIRGDGPLEGFDLLEDERDRSEFISHANYLVRYFALTESEVELSETTIHEFAGGLGWPDEIPEPERVADPT